MSINDSDEYEDLWTQTNDDFNSLPIHFNRPASMTDDEWKCFRKGFRYGEAVSRMSTELQEHALGEQLEAVGREQGRAESAAKIAELQLSIDALKQDRNFVLKQLEETRANIPLFHTVDYDEPIFTRISAIKALRHVFGYGLRDGKEIVDAEWTRLGRDFDARLTLRELFNLMNRIQSKKVPNPFALPTFKDLLSDDND